MSDLNPLDASRTEVVESAYVYPETKILALDQLNAKDNIESMCDLFRSMGYSDDYVSKLMGFLNEQVVDKDV